MLLNKCGPLHGYGSHLVHTFVQRLSAYDPSGLFVHPMFKRIANGEGPTLYPGEFKNGFINLVAVLKSDP